MCSKQVIPEPTPQPKAPVISFVNKGDVTILPNSFATVDCHLDDVYQDVSISAAVSDTKHLSARIVYNPKEKDFAVVVTMISETVLKDLGTLTITAENAVGKSVISCRVVNYIDTDTPVLKFYRDSYMLYGPEYEHPTDIGFEIINGTIDTVIDVEQDGTVDVSLAVSDDYKSGVITVNAKDNMNKSVILHITATTDGKSTNNEITLERAFLDVEITGNKRTSIDNHNRTVNCAFRTVRNLVFDIHTNAKIEFNDYNNGWLKARYDGVSNSITTTVEWNELQEPRTDKIIFYFGESRLPVEYTINQEAGEDVFMLERNALIALYNAMDGPNWVDHHTPIATNSSTRWWCTDRPLQQWYGVEVWTAGKDAGHVYSVHVPYGFYGELPEEIGDLIYCKEFKVISDLTHYPGRYAYGKIPESMADMWRLEEVDFSEGKMEGELENCSLKELIPYNNLKIVSITSNNFTGNFPEWIGDMKPNGTIYLPDGIFRLENNRLSGKVPEKVQKHPWWSAPACDFYGNIIGTMGQVNMKQQEGYVLYE